MKIIIMKKGTVDCTSDSRTYPMIALKDSINGAIKIIKEEVLSVSHADFFINDDCKLIVHRIEDKIKIVDKETCLRLLNYFKENPEELLDKETPVHIHVRIWNWFNDGNGCSDYIDIKGDLLEVSCQDEYDPDMRDEFHDNIESLLGDDYAIVIQDKTDNNELISLHINVTEKCQAGCTTCYVNRGLERELQKEDWQNLPLAKQYAIGGGEPSEYPFISELVDYLKNERKGYVAITTNGQKIINFNTKPDKIAVSIDGLTQEEHSQTHNTDLSVAEGTVWIYKKDRIKTCINHVLHRDNIDNVEEFVKKWLDQGHEINLVLFTGDDKLKPTYKQLEKLGKYLLYAKDEKIMTDSCMSGLLNILAFGGSERSYPCMQGLFSSYYRFGSVAPCSHSVHPYPKCKVIEEYMIYFFRSLRPMVFIYNKDGTSGAHEWAFKAGYRGKICHKIDNPLIKNVIYILTYDENSTIKEPHYVTYFKDKAPYWLCYESPYIKDDMI